MLEINWHPSSRELRVFAALLTAALVVAGWLVPPGGITQAVFIAIAVLVAVIGAARPQWLRPAYLAWMLAGFPIGWLLSHLVLLLVYYLLMTPLGLLRRLMGHDPLARRFDRAATTYWQPRRDDSDPFRQF